MLHAAAREAEGRTEATPSMVVIDTHLARGASNGGFTFHDRGGPYGRTKGAKRIVAVNVTGLPVGALVVPASTHENRTSELMLEHLTRRGVTGPLELVLVDRGLTAAAARRLGRLHDLEVAQGRMDDKQSVFRPIRHAWRVEVARALRSEVCVERGATVPYRAPMSTDQPPASVLRAFGVEEPPRPLPGGQGSSWAAEELVFKPGADPVHEWLAQAVVEVLADGFRLAAPVRTLHGTWSWEGWSATRWVEGVEPDHTKPSTWLDILEAGRAFHRTIAHLDRPDCLDARDDWWAVADRVAWGEHVVQFHPEFADLSRRLQRALEPLGPPQIVHADLTRNVLFSPMLSPAVIDISPYWRPPEYAEGVVVADALCWHGAHASLLDQAGVSAAAVARALLFRMTTTNQAVSCGRDDVDVEDEARRYHLAAAAIRV